MNFNKIIPELSVTNLEISLKFYKTLGFKIEYERPENKFVFLSMGEIQFMIQEISDDDKWDVAPLSYPFGNEQRYDQSIKGAVVSNGKVNNQVLDIIKKYVDEV